MTLAPDILTAERAAWAPGLYPDMPMAQYLRLPAVGASDLWTITTDCPAVARWHRDHPDEQTDATRIGTALHALALEPDAFEARYAIRPEGGPRANSNAYKDWAAEHIAAGREILTADEGARIQAMRAALPPAARKLLRQGRPEVTGLWRHDCGVLLRTRPDWLRGDGIVVDVKTTMDARPARWERQARQLGYHVSGALCLDLLAELTGERHEYVYLVVAKDPPHVAYLAPLTAEDAAAGREIYRRALDQWAACEAADRWDAWGEVVNVTIRDTYGER